MTRLSDSDIMPFGAHKGKELRDVPDSYWKWFLKQSWCDVFPDLVEYANTMFD